MDKITTPMAVLLSGILIFIGLYLNYSNTKYYVYERKILNDMFLMKINIHTGEECVFNESHNKWGCKN